MEGESAQQGSSITIIKEHINCSALLGIGSSQLNVVVGFATHCDFIIPPEFLQKMWNSIGLYETSSWNLPHKQLLGEVYYLDSFNLYNMHLGDISSLMPRLP